MRRLLQRICLGALLLSLVAWPAQPVERDKHLVDKQKMRFASDMARRGAWREAMFRWERLHQELPKDRRVLNNLGVAAEVLGMADKALDYYGRSIDADRPDSVIDGNRSRFERFWKDAAPELDWDEDAGLRPVPRRLGKSRLGKTYDVTVELPVPPRLKLEGEESVLVASFLHQETDVFDIDREMVRFLRREFVKNTTHNVLDINPPPAVPEQTIEDLIANAEFWRYLGDEFDADIVISGVLVYANGDASTFKDVDVVSNVTGQKVRTTRFVEQEEFNLVIDLLFMNGRTGELMFRDRVQRAAVFPGLANDPLTAFYALGETIVGDVLAVVVTRRRSELRQIFR